MARSKLTSRERSEAAVAEMAEKMMNDTRYSWLRTRRARLTLVWLMAAMFVAVPAAYLLGGSIAGILSVLAAFVLWGALRVSVRVVADLPDTVLDERQVALRNAVYLDAYRLLGGLVVAAATAGLIVFVFVGREFDTVRLDLSWDAAMAVFWALELAALALPSMVFAVRDRELPAEG